MSEEANFDAHMRDLATVGGPDFGPRLLRRFVAHMEAILSACAAGETPTRSEAHRTAGLAGIFGFREAGDAWSALEGREAPSSNDLSRAVDAATRCLALARNHLDASAPAD